MTDTKVQEITANEAFELIQKDPRTVLIDVRSDMEFLFVGHPKGAIHVAWIDEPDWVINPNFTKEVRKVMLGGVSHTEHHGNVPVILICRSGKRSLEAGEELIKAGMADVYNISDGFEGNLDDNHQRSTIGGWRFHGLPWEQC